ncbi:UrcA family protein [Sphingopyxis sp. JAI128]|uniref:UrcA family protein n=1 Tax=Sphingopyxis sp. JAI128 TaxID=2723066 RepID=UPI001608BC28|nr:UrcA family protein [Sphingopyxis sp. JAI128]MBB6425645.1 UrcA family protein [Sphingopyxis sp. JAI128]
MQKLLILAALAAATVGQPVAAQTAPANSSVAVTHKDLDLRTEAGTRALDRRIWRAVVEVCGTAPDFDIAGKNDVRQCRRDTRALASAQADVVIASATRDQPIRVSSFRK